MRSEPSLCIHVAAAALTDGQGRVLLTRRPDHVHQGGLWEFPGGKLEPGESVEGGLIRELREELGIRLEASEPLIRVRHDYGDRQVLLDVQRVLRFSGIPHGREGQPLRWTHPHKIRPDELPAADRPVILALRLPDRYLITGPDPLEPDAFLDRLAQAVDSGSRLVQLRAPGLDPHRYADLARRAYACCVEKGALLILNAPLELVQGLPRHGLHLSADRLATLENRPGEPGLLVGASCHDAEELGRAEALGLDYAFLSPVRQTISHPEAPPLGWDRFAYLVDKAGLPVYALGGLSVGDLAEAKRRGAQGIAAIRAFWSLSAVP